MKKNILLGILCLILLQNIAFSGTKIIQTQALPTSGYENRLYAKDLKNIERYMYGKTYTYDSIEARLARIEKSLFGNIYLNLNYAQRMNNILSNYRKDYDDDYSAYTQSQFRNANTTAQRLLNRFIGQPTGFTPPIMNSPFDSYGYPAGINRYNRYNNGYGYNNSIPMRAGAGVHIID